MKFCFRSTTILLLACSVVTIPLHARNWAAASEHSK